MGSALRNSLKFLCSSHGWSYAIFWRFHPLNSFIIDSFDVRLLTVEDAYYQDQLGQEIANLLLPQVHFLGEGVVGEAAFTGKHRWMLSDFQTQEWNFTGAFGNQDHSELHQLFSFGIKTIAVVSVKPWGVVQFGSTQKILEREEFLEQTQRLLLMGTEHVDMLEASSSETPVFPLDCENNYDLNGYENLCYLKEASCLTDSTSFDVLLDPNPCFVETFSGEVSGLGSSSSTLTSSFDDFPEDLSKLEGLCSSVVWEDFSELCSVDDLCQWFSPSSDSTTTFSTALMEDSLSQSIEFAYPVTTAKPASSSSESKSELTSGTRKKGLFSELGIEELLKGGSGRSSFEDEISRAKRRRMDYSSSPVNTTNPHSLVHWNEINYGHSINGGIGRIVPQKPEEPAKTASRKRARPGESTRPRPKDRQQIQDRIKELRGIIPSGGKCSIDSLLDRTIKYMLFLQSITKYADKLQEPKNPKLIEKANGVGEGEKEDGGGGGATWAFEVAGQTMVCPIVVEDMSSPGQMLIEILCEEQGLFLEITEIIRGFGLNILKGTMEIRENKLWGRFIVEAKRPVTRIDVFWYLVQLLQQQTNTSGTGMDSYQEQDMPLPVMGIAE
ncbi:transcription factor bHLH157 [Senna tora]|uniref:Transcription factor bHLH157 n=1 Tax=Senna tora TaxID=362788 RepID=A0A834TT77_9FABA|nr:transcription factor bHLH157 [Senna tora]